MSCPTPANRAHFGSASNQYKDGAFPQLQLLALCEVGTHAVFDPELVEQELYGLMLAHFVVRSVMAAAAAMAEVEPCRLSFKRSQEIVEDYLMEKPGRGGKRAWLRRLVAEVSRQQLRQKEMRSNPRVKKVTRCKWPGKKAEDKGRVHELPLAEVCRVVSPLVTGAGQAKDPHPAVKATG